MLEDLNAYHVFYQVVRCKSMHAAAEQLGITPVTVTRVMQNLEQSLNCNLLVRMRRGVALTGEGEKLYERIKFAFDTLSHAEERIAVSPSPSEEALSIGVAGGAPYWLLYERVIPALKEQFHNLQITLDYVAKDDIANAILKERFDFVIGTLVSTDSRKITNIPLYDDVIVPAVGKRYAQYADRAVTFSELKSIPYVSMPMDHSITLRAAMLYQRNREEFRPALILPDFMQQMEAVSSGHGYAFFPSSLVFHETAAEELTVLQTDFERLGDVIFCLYYPSHKALGAVSEAFLSLVTRETAAFGEEIHHDL